MRGKLISVSEVQVGDVIRTNTCWDYRRKGGYEFPLRVVEVVKPNCMPPNYRFRYKGYGVYDSYAPWQFVALLHRPRPKGKTESGMLREVALVAASVAYLGESFPPNPRIKDFLSALREKMDAYELSLPMK